MSNEIGKKVITIDGILCEFKSCGDCQASGEEGDARRALLEWQEDQPTRCAHCGTVIRFEKVVLIHGAALWRAKHIWEVSGVVRERGRILNTAEGMGILIHDACAKVALPYVDWPCAE